MGQAQTVQLEKLKFGLFGQLWGRIDHLVLLAYDRETNQHFHFAQRTTDKLVKELPIGIGVFSSHPLVKARSVVGKIFGSPFGQIFSFGDYQGTLVLPHTRQHFVWLMGYHIPALLKDSVQQFDPTSDMSKIFGPHKGPAVETILQRNVHLLDRSVA